MQRTAVNKRKMKLMKQYDSSMDIICDDGTLRFRKVCDHCGKEFMASRPNGRFGCTKCHVVIGKKAPELCPVCKHPKSYFMIHPTNF